MRKHKYYKHDYSTDLVIEPIRTIWLKSPERLKVQALLYTCAYEGKLILQDKCEWTILKEDWNKWKLYEN